MGKVTLQSHMARKCQGLSGFEPWPGNGVFFQLLMFLFHLLWPEAPGSPSPCGDLVQLHTGAFSGDLEHPDPDPTCPHHARFSPACDFALAVPFSLCSTQLFKTPPVLLVAGRAPPIGSPPIPTQVEPSPHLMLGP